MAYVSDVSAAQSFMASLRDQRDQEEAATMEIVNRLRASGLPDDVLESRERAEWRAFSQRVAPLEREIQVITGLIASVMILEGPSPIVISR